MKRVNHLLPDNNSFHRYLGNGRTTKIPARATPRGNQQHNTQAQQENTPAQQENAQTQQVSLEVPCGFLGRSFFGASEICF